MVNDVMIWMNSKMNQQSKQSLTIEPVVKISEIQAKTRVSHSYIDFFCLEHMSMLALRYQLVLHDHLSLRKSNFTVDLTQC